MVFFAAFGQCHLLAAGEREVRANDACNSCVMEVTSEGPSKNMIDCSAEWVAGAIHWTPEVCTWVVTERMTKNKVLALIRTQTSLEFRV